MVRTGSFVDCTLSTEALFQPQVYDTSIECRERHTTQIHIKRYWCDKVVKGQHILGFYLPYFLKVTMNLGKCSAQLLYNNMAFKIHSMYRIWAGTQDVISNIRSLTHSVIWCSTYLALQSFIWNTPAQGQSVTLDYCTYLEQNTQCRHK